MLLTNEPMVEELLSGKVADDTAAYLNYLRSAEAARKTSIPPR